MNNIFRKMFSATKSDDGKETFRRKFVNVVLSFRREKLDKSSVTVDGSIATANRYADPQYSLQSFIDRLREAKESEESKESREQSVENTVAQGLAEPAPTSETECDLKPKVTITRLVDLTFYLLQTRSSLESTSVDRFWPDLILPSGDSSGVRGR